MSATHRLKTYDLYWRAVESGSKNFEVRRNDREFQAGDILKLIRVEEDDDGNENETRDIIIRRVTYVLQGGNFGIARTHCVLGLEKDGKFP